MAGGTLLFAENTTSLARTQRPKTKAVEEEGPDQRRQRLSNLLAVDAAKDRLVIDFRNQGLGGKLLPKDEVLGWIERQAMAEMSYDTVPYLKMPIDSNEPYLKAWAWALDHPDDDPDPSLVQEAGHALIRDFQPKLYLAVEKTGPNSYMTEGPLGNEL